MELCGWLIYDREGAKKNHSYIQMHMEEAARLSMHLELMYREKFSFGVKNGRLYLSYEEKCLELPDFAIVRTIAPEFSANLERMGIRLFNSAEVSTICNDKAKTCAYLAGKGIPMPDMFFLDNEEFVRTFEKIPMGMVIKAVDGHGGTQVFRKEEKNKEEILRGIGNSNVVVQQFVGTRCQDVRVYVIGEKVIAAVIRKAKSGFKSNFSLGGDVSIYKLSDGEEQLVKRIVKQFSFGMVGIDFLIDDNGKFVFNEIEDVVGARMLYQCTSINLLELYLSYIKEQCLMKG